MLIWGSVALVLLVGCNGASGEQTATTPPFESNPFNIGNPWNLSTMNPDQPSRPLMESESLGFRVGPHGTAQMPDGSKLEAFSINAYQAVGEEKVLPIGHPLDFTVFFDGQPVAVARGDFNEYVDLRTGQHVCNFPTTKGSLTMRTSIKGMDEVESIVELASETVKVIEVRGESQTWKRTVAQTHTPKVQTLKVLTSPVHRVQKVPSNPPQTEFADIQIDGPLEDQVAVRSFLFHLRRARPLSPYGLSASTYSGHTFWDQDTWVFPALAIIDPEGAKRILNYRSARIGAAQTNATSWLRAGRPTARAPLGATASNGTPLMFPWESSVSGKETVPGESRFEHHISGSVARSFGVGKAFGLVDSQTAERVIYGVGDFYRLRTTGNEIRGTMSPDEFFIGDNDLYTNLVAQWCMNGGKYEGSVQLKLPRDDKSLLTYDGDKLRSYKQAAAVLAIYPLQFPEAEAQARTMMERFEDKVTKNGPAMTDSIHALIWARLGETEKAYIAWKRSWRDFVKGPFLNFSEKRSKDSSYFYTGAGGCLQTVLYGFLGFRLDSKQAPDAVWSKQCPGNWLSIKPNLPKAWKSITLKGFSFQGQRYTLTVTPEGSRVEAFAQPTSPLSQAKE